MDVVITALGPDNVGLADPIIHYVTGQGARIAEIQMYDHDEAQLFAMLCRVEMDPSRLTLTRKAMQLIAEHTHLAIRVWSPEEQQERPRLALCTTYLPNTARAILEAVAAGHLKATVPVVVGNRRKCQSLAEEFGIPFVMVGDDMGQADEAKMIEAFDEYTIDYVILARYMRVLSPSLCWQFAGGRIINLHHGLLPGFPGLRPYHDAFATRMLTFGATCHFIVPELDAGNQIINQRTFTVAPGTGLDEIVRQGQEANEPACLVEGVRRVVDREVKLHFHRVIATPA
jgi:formyltetrahydrofolate deformylase